MAAVFAPSGAQFSDDLGVVGSEIIVLLAGTLPGAEVSLTAMAIFSNTCCLDALTWILRGLFIFNPPKK
jgi:hypothetical protein